MERRVGAALAVVEIELQQGLVMTRVAADRVGTTEANGTSQVEVRAAAWTSARQALHGMPLEPAAAGDRSAGWPKSDRIPVVVWFGGCAGRWFKIKVA